MSWEDIIAVGMGELGITDVEELFTLSWVEWEYRIEHYRISIARYYWEPERETYTLIASILGEKKTARELIPLLTDEPITTSKTSEKEETSKELWQRLVGSASPLTPAPADEKITMD